MAKYELPAGVSIAAPSGRQAELCPLFSSHTETITVQPKGWVLAGAYREYAKELQEYEFEKSDVILMTFPKSGTTWLQEIVWTLRNNADLSNPKAAVVPLPLRSPYFEGDILVEDTFKGSPVDVFPVEHGKSMERTTQAERPRTIKTHLSFDLLSPTIFKKAKVVYMLRDPRDVCISYYYHCRLFNYEGFTGTFEQFVEAFLEDATSFGPYWSHVKEAWAKKDEPNVHVMSYEILKKNTMEEYRKLNNFLKTNVTDDQLEKIIEYCSFGAMKQREHHAAVKEMEPYLFNLEVAKKEGGFFKKGESGRHKEVLTQEHQQRFAAWATRHCPDAALRSLLMP